jgi:copper(I)-binding protein
MKKQIYLIPLFALSLAALTLAGCDDKSNESSVPAAPGVEETAAPVEESAASEVAPVESHINVTEAVAYATAASARNGAVFATITNSAAKGDVLADARSTIARVEVHQSYEDPQTGAMLMRRTAGVDVPANGSTKLEPTGFHIMLLDLSKPLVAGETFDVELRFRDAGKITVPVTVITAGGDAAAAEPEVQHESADHDDHAHDHSAEETDAATPEATDETDATASEATSDAVEETPATDDTSAE